ncbi:uncharacterized protein AMSG_11114 [Thecamonas trahens ATCC 50062]|uniref:JmjC domain-containing protein n=1 Tax=Thecamonas trahens ATCC 50062 TaxID=461836 RepID=A0A0L0DT59_THETB|nr:hypothetical protein AMSG_11114 [Thecamonas trahens ATCC 50062]KNC55450.1 hypothetical protein AMSG_11114 [Thecamonas trahens ATCC 50062]|eukprot:XP_013752987.1 hypothetical protein AMSG_11114 [Thecamonas trahens ATCC 50062]
MSTTCTSLRAALYVYTGAEVVLARTAAVLALVPPAGLPPLEPAASIAAAADVVYDEPGAPMCAIHGPWPGARPDEDACCGASCFRLNGIATVAAATLTASSFEAGYMARGQPVLLDGGDEWFAQARPVLTELGALGRLPGAESETVCVASCAHREFTDQRRDEMTLAAYAEELEQVDDAEMAAAAAAAEAGDAWAAFDALPEPLPDVRYLKDFHYQEAAARRAGWPSALYSHPPHFATDWLGAGCAAEALPSDYSFVYVGPSGSWTPFHTDVYRSFSWSANVSGTKLWILVPPAAAPRLREGIGSSNTLVYDLRAALAADPDLPAVALVQRSGQALFVPSGWAHQVFNLTRVASVNCNWFNHANVADIVLSLARDAVLVAAQLADLAPDLAADEWRALAEQLLLAHAGLNWATFRAILDAVIPRSLPERIILARIRHYIHFP